MDLRDRIEAHKDLIKDRLDPDFGLLDELLVSRSLSRSEVSKVKAVPEPYGRSEAVLGYVFHRSIYENFLHALKNTQQTHLANCISSSGERRAEFGDDWPLTEREISILDTNQRSLVDLLETSDLLSHLYSHKVINNRQRDFLSSKTSSHEKNDALLEILRRTSLHNYYETINCLHLTKQSHIANVLKEGGAFVRVRSELETESDVNQVEDELITKITEMLEDRSLGDAARILECSQLRLIAAKRGNSVILYFVCKTMEELVHLKEMQTSEKLAKVIRELFNQMLSRTQVINLGTTLYDEDFSRCELGFRGIGSKGKLKESCDEDDGFATSKTAVADEEEKGEQQPIDIIKCPICTNAFTDPRMLPCCHTLCFQCLKSTSEVTQEQKGDKVTCPVCGEEFAISADALPGLQKNFPIEDEVLESNATLQTKSVAIVCDVCSASDESKAGQITLATMRCLECQDNYCDNCVKVHQLQTLNKRHQMIGIGIHPISEIKQSAVVYCSKHTQKPLDYYCADCRKIVCVSCFVESHPSHKCKSVNTVDEEFRQTIRRSVSNLAIYSGKMLSLRKNSEIRKSDYLDKLVDEEIAIHKRNKELKDMIDEHTRLLLDELAVMKSKHLDEMEKEVKQIDMHCAILRRFEAYCTELTSTGSANTICSSVDQLIGITEKLEQDYEAFIGRPQELLEVSFQAADIQDVLEKSNNNLVGHIEEIATQLESYALVVGLYHGRTIRNDVIDIDLHRSNEIAAHNPIPTTMTPETVAAVFCNTVYVTGLGDSYNEIWKYDMASGFWKQCASLVQGRRRHSAAFIDEVLYICGGYVDSNGSVLDSVEAYNAVIDNCSTVGKLVHGVESAGNCVPIGSSLFIFGGGNKYKVAVSHVQVYDTQQNTCTLHSKPMPRGNVLMRAAFWKTFVILLGRHTCFVYNTKWETWEERRQFKTGVFHFGLVLENEQAFVIGGGTETTSKHGKRKWKCGDDVRCVPLQNIIDNKPIAWRHHGNLPKPSFVHGCAKVQFPVLQ